MKLLSFRSCMLLVVILPYFSCPRARGENGPIQKERFVSTTKWEAQAAATTVILSPSQPVIYPSQNSWGSSTENRSVFLQKEGLYKEWEIQKPLFSFKEYFALFSIVFLMFTYANYRWQKLHPLVGLYSQETFISLNDTLQTSSLRSLPEHRRSKPERTHWEKFAMDGLPFQSTLQRHRKLD